MPETGQTTERTEPSATTIIYEQPLNERMRTFLRLEFLYTQTLYHQQRSDTWAARAAVASILEMLAITARGDIRSDVLKELERQMAAMHEFQSRPGVDTSRLHAVLENLARLRTELNAAGALVRGTRKFADHHHFTQHEATELLDTAAIEHLTLVTTEKDIARMRGDPALAQLAQQTVVLPVAMTFDDDAAVRREIIEKLFQKKKEA